MCSHFAFIRFEAENYPPNHISSSEGVCQRGPCHRSDRSRIKMGSPGNFYILGELRLNVASGEGRGAVSWPFAGSLAACPETEGNRNLRALSITPVPRINANRVQSALSLGGSKMTCSFPGFPARSRSPSPPRGGAHQGQPRVQAPLWVLGLCGGLGEGTGERTGQSVAASAPYSVLSLWPPTPPSSPPANTFGSSAEKERNNTNIKKPVPGVAERQVQTLLGSITLSLTVLPLHRPGVTGSAIDSDPPKPLIGCMKGPKCSSLSCVPSYEMHRLLVTQGRLLSHLSNL